MKKTIVKSLTQQDTNITPVFVSISQGAKLSGLSYAEILRGIHQNRYSYKKIGNKFFLHYEDFLTVLKMEARRNAGIVL